MDSVELEAAVKSGVITPDVANRLRNFSAEQRQTPLADEERFGLVGGLADVMTAAGLLLLLGGVAFAFAFIPPVAIVIVLGASWAFAEHFTRQRRMTLTSFVLFGAFVVAALCGLMGVATVLPASSPWLGSPVAWAAISPLGGLIISFGTAMICGVYWLRFKLPFAYMAAAVAAVNAGINVVRLAVPYASAGVISFMLLVVGLLLFVIAMWWDMSDVRRETRRADIAFWMHWAAGYQVAGASFRLLLGVTGGPSGWERLNAFATQPATGGAAIAVLCLFSFFCVVALIIDRRSLLMSSLIYVVPATAQLMGALQSTTMTMTAMLTGGFLVVLAAYWREVRALLLAQLPAHLRAQLPRTDLSFATSRPVA
ncbi:hypothetical protein FPZ24_09350 [Sphingomonas panacisoli]|uniref:DUF2157 domain-containing protein n=1 Tax=Sphingomonas panacisoli TaxID=1813879 RepID=A0A5B8LHY7_9SPHN|nr:hypothetical protein [Sphingomonas panacisoli]QDZ07671.1 hypothetical protein FPZ24_09350 [Sphingomonas panacisoli]